jgi:hypothetical protein
MTLYSVDVRLVATAYIRARNKREALRIAVERYGGEPGPDVVVGASADVSALRFNDPNLPDVSLSPCMTANGPCGEPEIVL